MLKEFNECSLFKYQSIIKNNNNIFYFITQITQIKKETSLCQKSSVSFQSHRICCVYNKFCWCLFSSQNLNGWFFFEWN